MLASRLFSQEEEQPGHGDGRSAQPCPSDITQSAIVFNAGVAPPFASLPVILLTIYTLQDHRLITSLSMLVHPQAFGVGSRWLPWFMAYFIFEQPQLLLCFYAKHQSPPSPLRCMLRHPLSTCSRTTSELTSHLRASYSPYACYLPPSTSTTMHLFLQTCSSSSTSSPFHHTPGSLFIMI